MLPQTCNIIVAITSFHNRLQVYWVLERHSLLQACLHLLLQHLKHKNINEETWQACLHLLLQHLKHKNINEETWQENLYFIINICTLMVIHLQLIVRDI